MSGVFGIVDLSGKIEISALLPQMARAMAHRDWYVVESWIDECRNVGIGRLGIGIFNRDPQPLWNSEHTVAIVMAGEIHQCWGRDVNGSASSQEEMILRLYEQQGRDFLCHLAGTFVLAIYDQSREQVIIATDRLGTYNLFYAHSNGMLVFAPEMKGVLCVPHISRKIDLVAIAEYMRFQHLLGDKTFFESVKLLPNASILACDLREKNIEIHSYWDFSKIRKMPNISFDEAVQEAGRLLKKAVERCLDGNYRIGVFLSAGLDSRLIAALASENKRPLRSITFGLSNSRDVYYARKIARKLKIDHHSFEWSDGKWVQEHVDFFLSLTEGFHSWVHAHGISVLPEARNLIDINLSGFNGDELNWDDLSGVYSAKDELTFISLLYELLVHSTTWPSLSEAEEKFLYAPGIAKFMQGLAFNSLEQEVKKVSFLPLDTRAAHFSWQTDRRLFLNNNVIVRSHLEVRFPYLYEEYFSFVRAIPVEMVFLRKLRRAVIQAFAPQVAMIPNAEDELPITDRVVKRSIYKMLQRGRLFFNRHLFPLFPEYGTLYADYETWLRNELKAWAEDILLSDQTLQRGLFNPDFIRALWQRYLTLGEVNIIGKIAPIMTLEMILRRFAD